MNWSVPVSAEEAAKRAGGRRRYNAVRRLKMVLRRKQVAEWMMENGMDHGSTAQMAALFGVSRGTIWKDKVSILTSHSNCPRCGTLVPNDRLKEGSNVLEYWC
jgi:hypothetical protein